MHVGITLHAVSKEVCRGRASDVIGRGDPVGGIELQSVITVTADIDHPAVREIFIKSEVEHQLGSAAWPPPRP